MSDEIQIIGKRAESSLETLGSRIKSEGDMDYCLISPGEPY